VEVFEIVEAVLLSVVAVMTALSGYYAASWEGVASEAYSRAAVLKVDSNELQLTANARLALNAGVFTAWLQAHASGDKRLESILERRFTEEYDVAFRAWLKTDPFTDPQAPAGPYYMPEFQQPVADEAAALADEATLAFDEGGRANDTSDHFVSVTIILAAVLFLVAIGQRFKITGVRYGLTAVAASVLVYCIVLILAYPHA
jgi:hypothetical protein